MSTQIDHVADKLKQLSPQRLAEVEDFIDFVAEREHERAIVCAAQASPSRDGSDARENRELAAQKMTPEQIVRAQEMASRCQASNYKLCD